MSLGQFESADGCWRLAVVSALGSLIERPVGPVAVDVVVVDVVDGEPVELATVPDDGAVKEFSAQGGDPTFRERVGHWDVSRDAQGLETFGSEDLVEVAGELAGAVSRKCSSVGEPLRVTQAQVARCMGGPGAGRVGGDVAVEDFAGGDE